MWTKEELIDQRARFWEVIAGGSTLQAAGDAVGVNRRTGRVVATIQRAICVHIDTGGCMTTSVGIGEFRAGLADFITVAEPVAVTRDGHTIGWFIPTPVDRDADVASLRPAASALDSLPATRGVDPDEVVVDFSSPVECFEDARTVGVGSVREVEGSRLALDIVSA